MVSHQTADIRLLTSPIRIPTSVAMKHRQWTFTSESVKHSLAVYSFQSPNDQQTVAQTSGKAHETKTITDEKPKTKFFSYDIFLNYFLFVFFAYYFLEHKFLFCCFCQKKRKCRRQNSMKPVFGRQRERENERYQFSTEKIDCTIGQWWKGIEGSLLLGRTLERHSQCKKKGYEIEIEECESEWENAAVQPVGCGFSDNFGVVHRYGYGSRVGWWGVGVAVCLSCILTGVFPGAINIHLFFMELFFPFHSKITDLNK